jgi:hypothetical protein
MPTLLSTAVIVVLTGGSAMAAPILYHKTAHFYDFIEAGGITWTEANAEAPSHEHLGHTGYLATITSQGENDFLYDAFSRRFWEGWLGGRQDLNSQPTQNWKWVTGESWSFTNWAPGEPNDAGGSGEERYLQMWGFGTVAPGHWNDDANDTQLGNIGGYFVEYESNLAPIPEPSTLVLTGIGLAIGAYQQRRRGRRERMSPTSAR